MNESVAGSPQKGLQFPQKILTFLPKATTSHDGVDSTFTKERPPPPKRRGSLCARYEGSGGLFLKEKQNVRLASCLKLVNHPPKSSPEPSRVSTVLAPSWQPEPCAQQLLRAHGAARPPQAAASTHQTAGLCQSSRRWASSLRSAAGELPTETKGEKIPLRTGNRI